MAQDTYQGDGGGYLSTDPYAGSSGGGVDVTMPPGPRGPNDGYYTPDGNWIPYGSEGPGGITGRGIPGAPSPQGPAPSTGLGPGMTRDQVYAYVQNLYQQKGVTPNGTDLNYWTDRYFDPAFNGDYNYWNNKLNNENESFGFKGNGGGVGYGSITNKLPTLADLQNMPGFQFALDKGLDAIDSGAAARGTLLTGGNQKDRADYATGMATQSYGTLAGLQNQYNSTYLNNLYNWGQLGFNASSFGPNSPS